MKKWWFIVVLLGLCLGLQAQSVRSALWPQEERTYRGMFFQTDQATVLADWILQYQLPDGGWASGVYYPSLEAGTPVAQTAQEKESLRSSLQGQSTLAEIHFLSQMYQQTARRKYRRAAEEGIRFLVRAQYSHGGWPLQQGQADPIISLADNTFINVMNLMYRLYMGRVPYDYVPDDLRQQCLEAFQHGVDFLLRTQCRFEGKPTGWCTNYSAESLLPVAGGPQQPVAVNSQITDDMTLLLQNLIEPSEAVKEAIAGARNWYETTKISGLTRQNYINKQGKRDFRFVQDRHAPALWALYYSLEDNQPIFCELDGTQVRNLDDLTYEARKSLSWYNNDGARLLPPPSLPEGRK